MLFMRYSKEWKILGSTNAVIDRGSSLIYPGVDHDWLANERYVFVNATDRMKHKTQQKSKERPKESYSGQREALLETAAGKERKGA